MIKAIAFDPGRTTGFATGEIEVFGLDPTIRERIKNLDAETASISTGLHFTENGKLIHPNEIETTYGPLLVQSAQAKMEHKDIFEYLQSFKPDYIICERFDFRQKARTGLELISREFIGIVELYVQLSEKYDTQCTLVMQTASQGITGYWSDDKLKRLTLYRKPISGVSQIHANEALKHLLYWYKFGSGSQYGKEIRAKSSLVDSSTISE